MTPSTTEPRKAPPPAVKRFQDYRFGMFIHYGLYSLLNRREWAMYDERIAKQIICLSDSLYLAIANVGTPANF